MNLARAALAIALVVPLAAAHAVSLVVMEARGIAFKLGQTLDSTKPLSLKQGQHLTLVTPTGATLRLDGPYDRAPDEAGQGVAVNTVLAALVTQRNSRVGEVGTTRGQAPNALPDPWVLDASRAGTVCLREGDTAVLWRPSTVAEATVAVAPSDRSWKAEARWPAGADRITIATMVPIRGGASYFVTLNGTESAIAVANVPAALDSDTMRAAWLAEKGCEGQARALLGLR